MSKKAENWIKDFEDLCKKLPKGPDMERQIRTYFVQNTDVGIEIMTFCLQVRDES